MSREEYLDFIYATNKETSQKAPSYLKALDYLEQMLQVEAFGFEDCRDLWSVKSTDRLQQLYKLVIEQGRKSDSSPWQAANIPPSYLKNNFCSAALKNLTNYVSVQRQEDSLFEDFSQFSGSGRELAKNINIDLDNESSLVDGLKKESGEDVLRNVKTRRNQNLFRRMILYLYKGRCCVSGLNIPALNVASHIVGWSENEEERLNPTNGLCLSSTYDSAFDKKLISFDDEFRMIVSDKIKDRYSNEAVKRYFSDYEGKQIDLPERYKPEISFLRQHREKAGF